MTDHNEALVDEADAPTLDNTPIATIETEVDHPAGFWERFVAFLPMLLGFILIFVGTYQVALSDTFRSIISGLGSIIVGSAFILLAALRDILDELKKGKEVFWNPEVALYSQIYRPRTDYEAILAKIIESCKPPQEWLDEIKRRADEYVARKNEPLPKDPDAQSIDVGAGGDWAGVPTPHKDEDLTPHADHVTQNPVTGEVGEIPRAEDLTPDVHDHAVGQDDDEDYAGNTLGENPPLDPKKD